jgi:competence protein ComEA
MTFFTKQEHHFLLFLVAAFLVGLAVKYVRKSIVEKPNDAWTEYRRHILAEFENISSHINKEDSTVAAAQHSAISKKSLTMPININTASLRELELLPRIGPATAHRIIAFREKNGPFEKIQEIQNVKNIGPKTFEKIKDYITVD